MGYEISRCEPFGEFLSLNRLFGVEGGFWAPLLDVEETRDEVIVRAELPGLKKEEIKLQVEGDLLVLSGERKSESESKEKTVHRLERVYGQFQRALRLPSKVDGGRATAAYEAGVLTVKLPKREEAKPKEIAIEVK